MRCLGLPFFPAWDTLTRILREIHEKPEPLIEEELRGWNWRGETLVAPSSNFPLGVSDITNNFCEKGRDIYLRYILGVKQGDTSILQRGRLVHQAFADSIITFKRLVYTLYPRVDGDKVYENMIELLSPILDTLPNRFNLLDSEYSKWLYSKIWKQSARIYSAELDEAKSRTPYHNVETLLSLSIPVIPEFPIDGSLIGLARTLRVDAYLLPGLLMEIKTRKPSPIYEASLAGYALAYESQYYTPIDYGLLVYVTLPKEIGGELRVYPKITLLTSDARTLFLEERDKRHSIIEYQGDPGKPHTCPKTCPYYQVCRRM
ncbi:MAG: type I-A CRISPR-associated protein Cas4/Csa1 [Desulfurococcales archaeon]|nr:type I-A CRISPR-associated protein Cas4/Csa1 [Desulfurococcales archaeon]